VTADQGVATRRDDSGTSLVEVMTAIFLATIVVAAVGTLTVLGLQVSNRMGDRIDNTTTAQNGMAATTRILRTAVLPDQLDERVCSGCAETAILQATPSQISFYANLDNTGQGPSLVTLQVVADPNRAGTSMLRQTLVPPTTLADGRYNFCDATLSSCTSIKRVICRGLPATVPSIFTYYDFDNDVITAVSLTQSDLVRVSSIEVSLTVKLLAGSNRSKPNTLVQRITLPNADVNVLNN
jgi:hypothetical protein